MFKIAKLEKINNEKLTISFVSQQKCSYDNGKKVKDETFKTLSFNISAADYSFGFDLNCKLEKLLEMPMEEMDFKDYILEGETWLNVDSLTIAEPEMNIKIRRYFKNKFIVFLAFYTDYYDNNYSGIIEFEFDLDDYLEKVQER